MKFFQVEVLNLYCDPKDSKTQPNSDDVVVHEASTEVFDKLKLYSVVHKEHKEYCRPYRGKVSRIFFSLFT